MRVPTIYVILTNVLRYAWFFPLWPISVVLICELDPFNLHLLFYFFAMIPVYYFFEKVLYALYITCKQFNELGN